MQKITNIREVQALDILNRFEQNFDDVEIEWPEGGI